MSSVLSRQCHRLRESLPSYAEGRLTGPAQAEVEAHLAACPRCAAEVAELRVILATLRAVPPEPLPDHLVAKVQRAVAARPVARPRLAWTRFALPLAAGVGLFAIVAATRVADQLPSMPWMPGQKVAQTAESPPPQAGSAPLAMRASAPSALSKRTMEAASDATPSEGRRALTDEPDVPAPRQTEAYAPPTPSHRPTPAAGHTAAAKPAVTDSPASLAKGAPSPGAALKPFSEPVTVEPTTSDQASVGGGGATREREAGGEPRGLEPGQGSRRPGSRTALRV